MLQSRQLLTKRVIGKIPMLPIGNLATRSFSAVMTPEEAMKSLGLTDKNSGVYIGKWIQDHSHTNNVQINPNNGQKLAEVSFGTIHDYNNAIAAMDDAKAMWSKLPAPERGEVVRKLGEKLREKKAALGMMISMEMGKIYTEGLGEVQEAIDICDYAVGLSRSLNGSVIPSERPDHFMMERYNPLKGHVGIISAFNFPVAVYFWNLAISLVCGNTNIWKPAESLSLTSVATMKLVAEVIEGAGYPGAVATMICGSGAELGEKLATDKRIELLSFTGSTAIGRQVAQKTSARFGKHILELGGNNAMIVDSSADIDLAVRATLFGAAGTAGQRCTSQRRTYLHADIYDRFLEKLLPAYSSIRIGNALDSKTLCGPVHNAKAVETFKATIETAVAEGGKVLAGGKVLDDRPGFFVTPTVIAIDAHARVLKEEKFVPIMYVIKVNSYEEAVVYNNQVAQGLSSSLFTKNFQQIFDWTGPSGSDCGIVNVNIGTSGAEIGGAFGGEKDTGGGRESGSDSWKQYMRRSTCTINYSDKLPLAQGVSFE